MDSKYSVTPKHDYTKTDSIFAWLSLLFAFFYCHTVPVWENALGGFALIFALFITAFIVLRVKQVKVHFSTILSSISAMILSFAFLLTESKFLLFLSCAYCLGSYLFLLYAALGNRVENGFSNYIYIDYLKILFIFPFCSFVSVFPAIFSNSSHKGTRFILKILIGIAIAIVPTALVFGFLSYDAGFMKIIDDIFSFNPDNSLQWFMSICFTLPLTMYGFGMYASSCKGLHKDKITAEKCDDLHKKIRVLPQITAVVATLPILFLYVVFFISQWKYFISGFTGVLPEGFSHAEYARQGFFELCAVSVINLLCIAAIAVFIGRGKKNKAAVLKLLTIVFCLCTFILISTAVAKLVMYIAHYGLTQKRIYAMWLMAVIALIFLVIALGQFISKVRIVALSCTLFIAMFIPLALCNVNAITAQYNTDRYLAGTLESAAADDREDDEPAEKIDMELMDELGDSAIPSLVRLAKSIDPEEDFELKHKIDCILFEKKAELQKERFALFAWNLPAAKAKAALQDYTPTVPLPGTYRVSSWNYDDDFFGSYDDHYYGVKDNAPILTIYEDGTGRFVGEGHGFMVVVKDCQIISSDKVFDIEHYSPFDDYESILTLTLTDDEQDITIHLNTVE